MTSQDSEGSLTHSFASLGREGLIGEAFVALADTLVDDYDVIDLLDRLVGYSVELLAADAAGIMLGDARSQRCGGRDRSPRTPSRQLVTSTGGPRRE